MIVPNVNVNFLYRCWSAAFALCICVEIPSAHCTHISSLYLLHTNCLSRYLLYPLHTYHVYVSLSLCQPLAERERLTYLSLCIHTHTHTHTHTYNMLLRYLGSLHQCRHLSHVNNSFLYAYIINLAQACQGNYICARLIMYAYAYAYIMNLAQACQGCPVPEA